MTITDHELRLAQDEDRWITVNSREQGSGSHVKIDGEGTVIAGMGGKFNGKNISEAHKGAGAKAESEIPEYIKSMKLGERQSAAYRGWQKELAEKPDADWKARQNEQVKQMFRDAEYSEEAQKLMKDFLGGKRSSIAELDKRYPQNKQGTMAKDSVQSILAFDRASVRMTDIDGVMHISRTPITKACVNGYYGREIPDSEEMGLEPDRLYKMLRCPDELRKAVPSANRRPLLNTHLPFLASAPPKDAVVGSTGENAEFDYPYLYNSMVNWDSASIAGIESGQQREISSSYRYRADMTPGVYNGEEYDGVMRDIVFNHVAIVPDGRAGPDVLVYDSKPKGYDVMSKLEKLWATILPRLAKDANPDEVKEEVAKLVEDEDDDKKDKPKTADDEQTQADKDNESEAMRLKEREEREEKDREKDEKMAKDSRLAMDALETRMRSQFRALREAEQMCEPIIGRVACDSAEEVYRMALKQKGVSGVDALHSSALKPMVEMLQNTKMAQDAAPVINSDSRSRVSSFLKGE